MKLSKYYQANCKKISFLLFPVFPKPKNIKILKINEIDENIVDYAIKTRQSAKKKRSALNNAATSARKIKEAERLEESARITLRKRRIDLTVESINLYSMTPP